MGAAPCQRDHLGRRHPLALALAVSIVGAVAYLIWAPQTLDLAAQTFRADLWERDGFVIWSPAWYGGMTVPGYSLLYPPLGALLGPVLLGAICAVVSTWLFGSIVLRAVGDDGWLAVIWFGLASLVAPLGGRTTFALGLAIGLGAVWLVQKQRPASAFVATVATPLASPVAGLFGGIAVAAVVLARLVPLDWWARSKRNSARRSGGEVALEHGDGVELRPRGSLLPAAAALAGFGLGLTIPVLAFPTGGFQPFAPSAFVWIPLAVAALLALTLGGSRWGALRWGAILYLALATFVLLVETPLGGNVTRLGLTFAGPILALVLVARRPAPPILARPILVALLALPLIYWQWTATVRDLAAAQGDPATEPAYYAPLLAELDRRGLDDGDRVHIPPTRNRWESVYVAERIPITRGWLRQLEAPDIDLFTGGSLTAATYASWLAENGAGWIALPDAPLDYIATDEAELIAASLDYLGPPVWSNEDWDLYRVGFGSGSGLSSASSDRATWRSGSAPRIRWSPYFTLEATDQACVLREGEWTRTEAPLIPGGSRAAARVSPSEDEVQLVTELSPAGALGRDRICDNAG